MSWWQTAPDAVALALLVIAPGAVALRLLGLRGLAALAGGPPVTLAALGVASVLFAPLGIPWRGVTVLAFLAVVLGTLTALVRFRGWSRGPGGTARHRAVDLGRGGVRWYP